MRSKMALGHQQQTELYSIALGLTCAQSRHCSHASSSLQRLYVQVLLTGTRFQTSGLCEQGCVFQHDMCRQQSSYQWQP